MDLLNKPSQKAELKHSKIKRLDIKTCQVLNRLNSNKGFSSFFGFISRLGNGRFWYFLIILQPVIYGSSGWLVSLKMLISGIIALILYLIIKKKVQRARPYMCYPHIKLTESALDLYSFPSGHTMHSVSFSLVLISIDIYWAILVLPFTILVSLSRIVLGLHYPSDVFVGILIGACVASALLYLS